MYFFDVGQGDAALVNKGNYQILIDGGPDNDILSELGSVMPLYDRKIEVIILSHPHSDHLVGINQILERYQVEKIYFSGVVHTSNQYLEFLNKIKSQNIESVVPEVNESFEPYEDSFLEFIWPGRKYSEEEAENLNNSSLVFRYCYFEQCAIFTGDIENDEQTLMMREESGLNAQILKISHHGSQNGTNQELLNVIKPKYAVITVGADNRYGHPHSEIVEMIGEAGIDLYRTDRDGTIKFNLSRDGIVIDD